MNSIVKEDLCNTLNELLMKQFKEFKWWLNSINYNGRPNIPGASMEKADAQCVVDLLIQYYGENALEVCFDVLQKCHRDDLAKKLEETRKKVADVDAYHFPDLSEHRNYIKKKFAIIKDPNAIPGEYVPLNQRYSKLIIVDYHPSEEEKEDEILAIGRKHHEIISKRAESSTSIEALFNRDKYGLIPQVVVLQGAAGIGKTIMAKKIMFDWASQQLYQDKFNYVLYICCRKMNVHTESEKSSIAEIISEEWLMCHESKNFIQNILKNEEKLLFIIDGFDELRYSFDQPKNYFCSDPWKKEPLTILLRSLFKKKLLPKSSLIITTRPTALKKLDECLEHSRNFEILGFSTKERQEYFHKFFENGVQATQALRFVKQNDTLFTMCVIPLVSWIICTVMKQEIERGKDLQKTPYTLTEIYILYFSSLLKFHHKEIKQNVQSNVKGLCSLAAEGVLKQKTLFMEEEVKKHSLDQENFLPPLLNQSIFKRGIDCIQTYSFIHLTFQAFVAALFYILEGEEQHSQNQEKKLQILLERHKSFRPDFSIGYHFLFGFLNEEKRMREVKKEFGWEISPKSKEFLLEWVKNNFKKSRDNFQLQKEMFSYLYETQDDDFIKNAISGITEIDYQCNSDMELMILSYCIQHCQNLKNLFIKGSNFLHHAETESFLPDNEEWSLHERYVEDFFKALTKLRNLSILRLDGEIPTKSCNRHLAEVLRKSQRLRELDLSFKSLDDETMKLLWDGLKQPECRIETLRLDGKIQSESCSRHLAEVFRKNQRLRVLFLSLKNPDEKPMELLCEGLKHPECTIETLEFSGEILSESCSRHLAEVFRENQRLRQLELSLKNPDEETMGLLCRGFKHPKCNIETLLFSGEILSESCSRHLAEVFRENQRLRQLELSLKNPDEETMGLLCRGFKHPKCNIETLQLNGKYIIQNGKWNETAMVETPARIRAGVKRLASSESLKSRKRRRPDRFQNS
uniref:Uncharacterized protein n=1 Tax=Naja naja TaxID=35670 RepID=A0A8C6V8K1_NAJNA